MATIRDHSIKYERSGNKFIDSAPVPTEAYWIHADNINENRAILCLCLGFDCVYLLGRTAGILKQYVHFDLRGGRVATIDQESCC